MSIFSNWGVPGTDYHFIGMVSYHGTVNYEPAIIADGSLHRVRPDLFCTKGETTSNRFPACHFCWKLDEYALSIAELDRWADEGGPSKES